MVREFRFDAVEVALELIDSLVEILPRLSETFAIRWSAQPTRWR